MDPPAKAGSGLRQSRRTTVFIDLKLNLQSMCQLRMSFEQAESDQDCAHSGAALLVSDVRAFHLCDYAFVAHDAFPRRSLQRARIRCLAALLIGLLIARQIGRAGAEAATEYWSKRPSVIVAVNLILRCTIFPQAAPMACMILRDRWPRHRDCWDKALCCSTYFNCC